MDVDGYGGFDLRYRVLGEPQLRLLDVSIQDTDSFFAFAEPLVVWERQHITGKGPKAPVYTKEVKSMFYFFHKFLRAALTPLHLGQATISVGIGLCSGS